MPSETVEIPSFGEIIAAIRRKNKMSVRELSRRLNVTHATVLRIEAGKYKVSAERLADIADIFGVTPGELYPGYAPDEITSQEVRP